MTEVSDFKIGRLVGFAKAHHKIAPRRRKWAQLWATGGPQNLKPLLIIVMAEASDFKLGTQLGFGKGHHKITLRGKSGRGPGLGKFPKILGFLFNISATAEASNFKFGCIWGSLGLPRAITKSHPEEKWAWHWARGFTKVLELALIFLQQLRLATSNLVRSLGLARAIIKSHPKEKWAWAWAREAQ